MSTFSSLTLAECDQVARSITQHWSTVLAYMNIPSSMVKDELPAYGVPPIAYAQKAINLLYDDDVPLRRFVKAMHKARVSGLVPSFLVERVTPALAQFDEQFCVPIREAEALKHTLYANHPVIQHALAYEGVSSPTKDRYTDLLWESDVFACAVAIARRDMQTNKHFRGGRHRYEGDLNADYTTLVGADVSGVLQQGVAYATQKQNSYW